MLRKLFPRPYFLPPESEVAMDKVLLVDAPSAEPYIVVSFSCGCFCWYVSGYCSSCVIYVYSSNEIQNGFPGLLVTFPIDKVLLTDAHSW